MLCKISSFLKNKLWILARKQPLFSWRADAILKA